MSDVIKGNAVIGQSGGPTAVINQSLVGVIESLAGSTVVSRLLGACHGVRGIVQEKFIDLKGLPQDLLERVAATPCAALGSIRDKPDEGYCHEIFQVFAKNDVRYFFYIGGNDSADTARIVSELAKAEGYELRVFHVPKTIDNDLRLTDHCPGYGSAARFVASGIAGDDRDNASLPGIKIDVVMGRNAGWLTAASVLCRSDQADGPHLVYVPEFPLTEQRFIDEVAEVYSRLGRCMVAVSEGVEGPDGVSWGERLALEAEKAGRGKVERDDHGNVQLSGSGALGDAMAEIVRTKVAAKLGRKKLRVRADTFGYLQRSFAGYASPVDQAEARLAGRKAVEYAMAGIHDGTVAFRRITKGGKYAIECFRGELSDVARDTKDLPKEFINAAGNGITQAFIDYALPLVGELPVIGKLPS
jgi:6-phosphofructokinase 1